MEKKNNLPTGITLRKDSRYMWRFKYNGQAFAGYSSKLSIAKKQLTDKRYEVSHGIYSKERSVNLSAWFNEWLGTYKTAECKESSLMFYKNIFKRYIEPEFGKRQIKSLKPEQIQKFTNRIARQYSKTTASTVNFLLYDCLQQAARLKIISHNPMDITTPPKFRKQEKRKALSYEHEKEFLKAVENSHYYRIYRFATLTGMRIGEILGLSWNDVDFEHEEIHITHTLCFNTEHGQYLDTPKSEAGRRTIPIPRDGKAYALLRQQQIEQKKQRLVSGSLWKPKKGMENLVFTTEFGTPHYDTNIRSEMRSVIRKLQRDGSSIEYFTFHTLRHCFATRCIENGMDPKTLQAILGHSTIAITMDLYCDVMNETKRREMEKISAAL